MAPEDEVISGIRIQIKDVLANVSYAIGMCGHNRTIVPTDRLETVRTVAAGTSFIKSAPRQVGIGAIYE